MQIKSKFGSQCPRCDQPIHVGMDVEWSPGAKATHVVCPTPAEIPVAIEGRSKSRFVLAMELDAASAPPKVSSARASARDHFVSMVLAHGEHPSPSAGLPPGGEEIVLTVGPAGRVMERAYIFEGRTAFYVRYNGGPLVDQSVNNLPNSQELFWRIKWSSVVQMAVNGLRR